jgi:4-amino-4-deoxy-L-arabinose transferase-like glycosyltransferase
MATEFLATGAITEEARQPLYPIAMAAAMRIAGEGGLQLLIALQVAMLFATAALAWLIAKDWMDRGAAAVFSLVLLNPNAVAVAHWPLADTLHALLFTIAVWALLAFGRKGHVQYAVVCGVATGLAALTRPESSLLIYVLPVALPLVRWSAGGGDVIRRGLVLGIGALVAALVVASPWMLHNQRAGHGFAITGGAKASDNLRMHFSYAEAAQTGLPQDEALAAIWDREAQVLTDADLGNAAVAEQRQFLARYYLQETLETSPTVLAVLFGKAWVAQFASGGGQSLNLLFGKNLDRPDKIMNHPGFFGAFFSSLGTQPLAAAAITLASVGFALVARLFGLAGFAVLIIRRHWPLLLVIVAVLAFKGLVHVFIGLSRYRLGVEPLLMILAVFGWQGIWAAFLARVRPHDVQPG